jgi:malonyl CoA-acyl carrier protein transacylase
MLYLIRRGEILEKAFAKDPFYALTLTGLEVEKVETIIEKLSPRPRVVAYHSPDACTLAGEKALLKKLAAVLKGNPSFKVRCGTVVPGMDWPHPMFEQAALQVQKEFEGLKKERSGTEEYFSSATGEWLRDHNALPELARLGCVNPLRFDAMIRAMRGRGMDTVVELGPSSALGAYTHAVDVGVRVLGTGGTKDFSSAIKLAN